MRSTPTIFVLKKVATSALQQRVSACELIFFVVFHLRPFALSVHTHVYLFVAGAWRRSVTPTSKTSFEPLMLKEALSVLVLPFLSLHLSPAVFQKSLPQILLLPDYASAKSN